MSITGQKVEIGIKIMNLIFDAKRLGPNVRDVMNYSGPVARLLTDTPKDLEVLANAIVSRMITVRTEVK